MITITNGPVEYEGAEQIAVPHAFTTRLGGVSGGYLSSLNIALHRGDAPENVEKNYEILAGILGFDREKLVMTHQVHSDTVRVVTSGDSRGLDHREYPQCDALVTAEPGVALVVFTADCTPVLLWDPVTGAVGAAHAGWRGTAAGIAGKTVRTMAEAFGCDPGNIRAAIGPNIGPCCFATDADVPQAMSEAYGDGVWTMIRTVGDKYYVNLKEINARSLKDAGVTHIEISPSCTACEHQRFWSHRVTGGARGSQGAVIVCKEVTP